MSETKCPTCGGLCVPTGVLDEHNLWHTEYTTITDDIAAERAEREMWEAMSRSCLEYEPPGETGIGCNEHTIAYCGYSGEWKPCTFDHCPLRPCNKEGR